MCSEDGGFLEVRVVDNTQVENLEAAAIQAVEVLDYRIRNFLTWMITIGLAATGFYLSFLFQVRDEGWIHESWPAKLAFLLLVTSIVIGFCLRALVEIQQTAAGLLTKYPFVEALKTSRLAHLAHELKLIKEASRNFARDENLDKQIQQLEDQLSDSSALCDEIIQDVSFKNELSSFSDRFKVIRLTRYFMLQGVTLTAGCTVSVYVFWGTVF
jgi:hypothetical protein